MKNALNASQLNSLTQLEKLLVDRSAQDASLTGNRTLTEQSPEVRDTCALIRFLKARDFHVEKAFSLYVQRLEWVDRVKPHLITAQEIESELRSGLLFFYGRDFFGRPIVYVRTCNHFVLSDDKKIESFFRYFVYMCELALVNAPPPPYNQFVIVSDQSFLSRKNLDVKGYKSLFCLGNYYPEVIHCIHILKTPMVFHFMYRIGKQFIDKKTMSKVKIHSDSSSSSSKKKKKTGGNDDTPVDSMSTVTDCLLPDHCTTSSSNNTRLPWLPESCPEQFVFAKLRALSNDGLNGPTEPYARDGHEIENEDDVDSLDNIDIDTPSPQPSNQDAVNDLDLD